MESPKPHLDPQGKAARVRAMFAEIAPRYDLLNHALSLNVDKRWRRFVVGKVAERLRHEDALALDLCCGTGDLALELGRVAETCGVDFCHPMLTISTSKVARSGHRVSIVEGDALNVPFDDAAFDVVTIGFGLRNLESVEGGLREILRLLKPGGRAAVLECSRPVLPVFRQLFQFYFLKVLPRIGNAISGSSFAYQYLPESVQQFPDQQRLAAMMRAVGFSSVNYYNLFGGVAAVHVGDKL
ncbi:MAG TPA: bifunctional demethylmenaquinone methyltransferase/2-methoxy-6-polyprenyl-1,4-benzoquinol methylase UbiE [Blastocatellia bacterium]|nr:bifunctional demethylmenaquinone methyltransferase/2-methoxy-6-polyprenyl-1,4-benzoquinol methylase UbiE [Blastocatellia bacterium]